MSKNKEENRECPLCMEPFEMDDINFFPCTCGYQICRFCWHRIRTNENSLCPACRKQYSEDPANFKPLTAEELQKIKDEKKQKHLQMKQKISEKRKHLGNLRVVQKNLVFVVGLPARLADMDELRKQTYFGKFGKIVKVIINQNTSYAGSQGPSASAYITYHKSDDALRAIQAVNNSKLDGRTLKASLGTTKYCSNFLRKLKCPKVDCMYLHEIGEEAGSFTKEEMQLGKHQEYEQRLHEQMIANSSVQNRKQLSPVEATDSTGFQHKDCWPSPSKSEVCPQSNLSDSPHSESTEGISSSALGDEDLMSRESPYTHNEESAIVESPEPKVKESVSVIYEPLQSQENDTSLRNNSPSLEISSTSAWPTIDTSHNISEDHSNQWNTDHVPCQPSQLYTEQCATNETLNVHERSSVPNIQQRASPILQTSLNANNISPTGKPANTHGDWTDSRSLDYLTQSQVLQALSVHASAASNNFSAQPGFMNSMLSQRGTAPTSRLQGSYTFNEAQSIFHNGVDMPSPSVMNCQNGIGNFNVSKLSSFNQNGMSALNQLALSGLNKSAVNCHSANTANITQTVVNNHNHTTLNMPGQNHILRNSHQSGMERSEDDDLGFDPFQESAKGLADLLQKEADERARCNVMSQLRNTHPSGRIPFNNTENSLHNCTHSLENSHFSQVQQQQQQQQHHHQQHHHLQQQQHHHQQQQQQQQMIPPPGFSLNSYGAISTPRPILGDAFPKKPLPVMNMYNQSTSALLNSSCPPDSHLQTGATAFSNALQYREKYSIPQMPDWQTSVSNMSMRQADSHLSSTSQRMPYYMGRAPASPVWNMATDVEPSWMSQEQAHIDSSLVNNIKLEKMFQQMKLSESTTRIPNQMKFNAFPSYRGGST